ncbi:hypothetical protein [Streptomyces poriticola]|uniref:hypothetical protein n=1 Tax=Streptomyces poriticola TaxID=3120506 RepID=UPI002FCE06E2
MSEETAPQQGGAAARPKGLLQQMEELMAALNADLSALDAELQPPGPPSPSPAPGAGPGPGPAEDGRGTD